MKQENEKKEEKEEKDILEISDIKKVHLSKSENINRLIRPQQFRQNPPLQMMNINQNKSQMPMMQRPINQMKVPMSKSSKKPSMQKRNSKVTKTSTTYSGKNGSRTKRACERKNKKN